jgi:hypothetical protein
LIRQNVDLGFGAGAVVGSGLIGMIRADVDSGVSVAVAARSRHPTLHAAKLGCRNAAPRRDGGMILRFALGAML